MNRLQSFTRTTDGLEVVNGRGSAQNTPDIRIFTTHNGRVGIASCEIRQDNMVACFSGSDIAVIVGGLKLPIKGRAFILKSDRRSSRGMGLSSVDAAAFRYAVPDVLDDEIYNFKNADIDGSGLEMGAKESYPHCRGYTLTLEEWQSLTW